MTGIIAALSDALGTAITIRPHPLLVPGALAITIRDPRAGVVVFVQAHTTSQHQAHLVLHELMHLVLGTTETLDTVMASGAQRVGDYSIPAELDAEYLARVVTARLDLHDTAQLPVQADPGAELLARTLADRIAW